MSFGVPGDAAVEDAGGVDDFGHRLLLAIGHHVDAAHALDLADFLDELDAELSALRFRLGSAGKALDHRVDRLPSTAFAPAYCGEKVDETTTGLFNATLVPFGGGGMTSLNDTFETNASLAPLA